MLALLVATAASAAPKEPSLMTVLPDLTPVSSYEANRWSEAACAFCFAALGVKRQALYEHGIAIDVGVTQTYQAVVSGGAERDWAYGGSADYYVFLDSARLGLWPGALLGFHGETKFGNDVASEAATLSPINADRLWPDPTEDSTFLSEYYLWQGITEWLAVMFGRVNWTALADHNRFANDEKSQFMNMSLRNTLLMGEFVPQSAHGAMVAITPSPHVSIILVAISANDLGGEDGSGPGGLFEETSYGVEVDLSWELAGLPGGLRPGFLWTTKDQIALDNPYLVPDVVLGLALPTRANNWIANLNFEQYLYLPEKSETSTLHTAPFDFEPEGIGVFFRLAYTPEDRNPWNWFVSAGFGGRGVIPSRPNDRYGLGFYALLESDDLKDQPIIGDALDDEWGGELYYNVAVAPWLQIGPSVQYIHSALPDEGHVVVVGTRMQLNF